MNKRQGENRKVWLQTLLLSLGLKWYTGLRVLIEFFSIYRRYLYISRLGAGYSLGGQVGNRPPKWRPWVDEWRYWKFDKLITNVGRSYPCIKKVERNMRFSYSKIRPQSFSRCDSIRDGTILWLGPLPSDKMVLKSFPTNTHSSNFILCFRPHY